MKTALFSLCFVLVPCVCVAAQLSGPSPAPSIDKTEAKVEHVSFGSQDGAVINADVYGEGDRGVVLAHGGQFRKESWQPQAKRLAREGYRVLAFDFRGFGESHGPGDSDMDTAPMQLDVLGAVHYL